MNTPFLQRPKQRTSLGTYIAIGGAVLFFLFGILSIGAPHVLEGITHRIGLPLWTGIREHMSFFNFFTNKNALITERDTLRARVYELETERIDMSVLIEENTQLRSVVGIAEREDMLVAPVLMPLGVSPFETMIIGRGTRDGLYEGAFVFASETIVVGTVESVFADTAHIRLLSAPERSIDARFEDGTIISLLGRGDGNFLGRMPKGSDTKEGSFVYVGGSDALIGTVGKTSSTSVEAFEEVYVRTPVQVQGLMYVFVQL